MRGIRFRFSIRTLMILVLIAAVFLTVWILVPRALDPLLSDRSGTIPAVWVSRSASRYLAVVALLTGIVASPFAMAIVLALKTPPPDRTRRRKTVRWPGVALSLACGLAILNFPIAGMRLAWLLNDGSGVCFYHQYRVWPGAQITPCLELITPKGRSRSYPITRNARYQGIPALRTNAEQTVLWFVDRPGAPIRYGGVWCAIDRTAGHFVGAGGPYPVGVSETSGFPPSR